MSNETKSKPSPGEQIVLDLANTLGILRSRDLTRRGLSRAILQRLVAKGLLERINRGQYIAVGVELPAEQSLMGVARQYPGAVICLVSALRFHDLTTQSPRKVWVAIERGKRAPSQPPVTLEVVRFGGESYRRGIEIHALGGVGVPVYAPAKTIADCFKFRNKVGLDLALEALRQYCAERRGTLDDLWQYAGICRVQNVMKPYLEALV
jgi:predicted transcriptional regulator of viral defense system